MSTALSHLRMGEVELVENGVGQKDRLLAPGSDRDRAVTVRVAWGRNEMDAGDHFGLSSNDVHNVGLCEQRQHHPRRVGKVIGQARQLILVCPAIPFACLNHVAGAGERQLSALDKAADVVWVPVGNDNHVDVGRRESCTGEALEHPACRR
jgi:hypothetical protein